MAHNPFHTFHSIHNPPVPFAGSTNGHLHRGRRILVRGHVSPHAQQFRIDLLTHHGVIALHINPRFNQRQIVRNTHQGGWGHEERHGPFPFRHNESFEVDIRAEEHHFHVSINGAHAFDYNYRVPIHEVSQISLEGDFQAHEIVNFGGLPAPVNEVHEPGSPASIPLINTPYPGFLIQIHGHIPEHARRFEIDLQNGPGVQPGDMALHFNPRWDDPHSPQPVIVRTHRQYGGWAAEDRSPVNFPFHRGHNFDLLILCDGAGWQIAVNGQIVTSYSHHIPREAANFLGIVGDIHVKSVRQFNTFI